MNKLENDSTKKNTLFSDKVTRIPSIIHITHNTPTK